MAKTQKPLVGGLATLVKADLEGRFLVVPPPLVSKVIMPYQRPVQRAVKADRLLLEVGQVA
jgi:hypothetical protein